MDKRQQEISWVQLELIGPMAYSELLAIILQDAGCAGTWFEERGEDVLVRGYLAGEDIAPKLEQVQGALARLAAANGLPKGAFSLHKEAYAPTNWAQRWKEYYTLQPIGSRFVIVPSWLKDKGIPEDRIPIFLDPGMAFGTGLHPTTQLTLEFVEQWTIPQDRVFDIGCGSGILAIGACKLGAGPVVAVDNDPVAVAEARENLAHNGISEVQCIAMHGVFPQVPVGQADLLIMNILAEVIIAHARAIKEKVVPGGRFIAGGITRGKKEDVITAICNEGFKLLQVGEREEWTGMVYQNE
ncbi:MAG TPA: 50S ribosomal protein L11 methyltransferase [Firmicutes bacterium]|nr:50S ribosomal protein L11 methyltransferase [Bacillota bacterium]